MNTDTNNPHTPGTQPYRRRRIRNLIGAGAPDSTAYREPELLEDELPVVIDCLEYIIKLVEQDSGIAFPPRCRSDVRGLQWREIADHVAVDDDDVQRVELSGDELNRLVDAVADGGEIEVAVVDSAKKLVLSGVENVDKSETEGGTE